VRAAKVERLQKPLVFVCFLAFFAPSGIYVCTTPADAYLYHLPWWVRSSGAKIEKNFGFSRTLAAG
jgi:hypothetical protein